MIRYLFIFALVVPLQYSSARDLARDEVVDIAKRFCVTYVGVIKWEKAKNQPKAMNWTTEKDIRLFVVARLASKVREVASLYQNLRTLPEVESKPLDLNEKKFAD